MTVLIIIAKLFISVFLAGILISGLVKLSPAHRNPDINPRVEFIVGLLGLGFSMCGLYFTWMV